MMVISYEIFSKCGSMVIHLLPNRIYPSIVPWWGCTL
jgi:hypothetical protein